jgi:hypothetical protein
MQYRTTKIWKTKRKTRPGVRYFAGRRPGFR